MCLTTSPIPAYADPPCDWNFDGRFQLDQQTGHAVTFNLHGKQFPPEGVRATYAGQGGHGYGSARGGTRERADNGIVGQNVFFTIWWENGSVGNYTGSMDGSGIASGITYDRATLGGPQQDRGWTARTPLKCVPPDPLFFPDRINPIAPEDRVLEPDGVNTYEPGDPNSPFGD